MIQRSCFRNLVQSFRVGSALTKFGGYNSYTSQAASSLLQVCEPSGYSDDECAAMDWDNLGFGLIPTDYMYSMKCYDDQIFEQGQLSRYGKIELSPSAGVLNYGQGLFEGLKAYQKENGQLVLFRMQIGAKRMCMPYPSTDQFIDAVKQTTLANKRWGINFFFF
ncbi:hypothetical protein ACOSP7_010457 [Xanthoceras sorbifolium]